jgi:hypothetical protein
MSVLSRLRRSEHSDWERIEDLEDKAARLEAARRVLLGQIVARDGAKVTPASSPPPLAAGPDPASPRPTVMFDAVDLSQIPAGAPAVAEYVGGNWPTFDELSSAFPRARLLSIAVSASEAAECLDVENGDATPEQAPSWVVLMHARGVWRPCVYAGADAHAEIEQALTRLGVPRQEYRRWLADWTFVPGVPVGFDARQWTNRALSRNLDESSTLPSFWQA